MHESTFTEALRRGVCRFGTASLLTTALALALAAGSQPALAQAATLNLDVITVAAGGSATLTVSVNGATSTAVAWKVDGVANGNATVGTITGSGGTVTYTAPAAAGTHAITVTSTAATAAAASVAVNVTAPIAPVVGVTLNPSGTATVTASGSRTFTASVTGATDTSVYWTVDGIANGNTSVGSISGSGATVTYTAPAATGTHTVTATSNANTSVSASTAVTVQAASAVNVSLSNVGAPYVTTGQASLFLASVTGTTNTAVTWTVDGYANGNATVGTIVAPLSGNKVIYNAPATAGAHTITATSVADPSKQASFTLTAAATTVQTASIPVGANVRNAPYSATGNGVTDDTAAIMAAVRAVAGTGKAVVVPAGTYMINPVANSGAGILLGSNMTLLLQPGAILKALPTSTCSYQVVAANSVSNVNIVGGTILGNDGNNSIPTPTTLENGNCIKISASQNVTVEGVTLGKAFCDGIYVAGQASGVTIANVTATACRRNGMSIVYGSNIRVTNSAFNANTGSIEVAGEGLINGSGVDVEPNANQQVSTVLFSRNTFNNNAAVGLSWGIGLSSAVTSDIFVDANTANGNIYGLNGELTNGSAVTNNTVQNNAEYGIYLHDAMYRTVCTGNYVSGTGNGGDGAGIEIYNDSGSYVANNTSTGNARYGVLSAYSTNPTVLNNKLTGNGVVGLRFSSSTGITSSGNVQ